MGRCVTRTLAQCLCGVILIMHAANKGAVGVSFCFEETPFCFVCSHLAARAERLEERRDNYARIIKGTAVIRD